MNVLRCFTIIPDLHFADATAPLSRTIVITSRMEGDSTFVLRPKAVSAAQVTASAALAQLAGSVAVFAIGILVLRGISAYTKKDVKA